jgi:putative DNA primase/helicase
LVGEATKAAAACLMSWMNVFGDRGNREESQLLEQVRSFFEANGASRFEDVGGDDGQRILHRCGFYRVVEAEPTPSGEEVPKKGGLREYLALPQSFRSELCAGFDFRFAVRVLKEHQWLIPGNEKTAQSVRVPGMGKPRAYVMSAKLWQDEQ